MLQTYLKRIENVKAFLKRVRGEGVEFDAFELKDTVGLSGTDKDLNAIILTHETKKGG